MTVKKNFYRIRGFVKDFLRIQFGVEFIRYPLHRWIRKEGISLVIDIGANRGQFAKELLRSGFRDRIVSIEPNPKAFKVLSMEAGRHENWLACNEAVGEIEGERILHITKSDASASFYSVRVFARNIATATWRSYQSRWKCLCRSAPLMIWVPPMQVLETMYLLRWMSREQSSMS